MKYAIMIFMTLIIQSCSNEKIENGWTKEIFKVKFCHIKSLVMKQKIALVTLKKEDL